MSLITITNLTFAYEGSYDNIFENVSFCLDTDWRTGLVGRNGRGKTTLLKLLTGEIYSGQSISKSVQTEYFPYEIKDKTNFGIDIAADIAQGVQVWEIEKELGLLDTNSEILYRRFDSLSPGEQSKILLAALFLKQNSCLLIDEPTNHLDIDSRKTVCEYLKKKNGFILVSHDRNFLDNCTDHTISINKQNIEIIKGNFSEWWQQKELKDNFEIQQNKKLKSEISRLEESAKKTADWSDKVEKSKKGKGSKVAGLKPDRGAVGAQAARVMKKSKNSEFRANKAITEKSSLLKNLDENEELKIHPLTHHAHCLVHIKNLSIKYDDNTIFSGISFDINSKDRVALIGKNGCGKSSVLKLILKENIPYQGEIKSAAGLVISYLSQTSEHLKGSIKEFIFQNKIDEVLFFAILRKLGFERLQFEKNTENLSQGQKKKLQLAASLCSKAHIYIWDEPLNYIDVLSRIQIEQLILKYCPTIIFVEHDSVFCDKIATKKVFFDS